MKLKHLRLSVLFVLALLISAPLSYSQSRGVRTISKSELKYHLDFLGSVEFRGRETPSPELEIATLYIGNWAAHSGLKPLLSDGSFYQTVPITVTSVLQPLTRMTIMQGGSDKLFYFGREFCSNFTKSGSYRGEVVFAGLGISDPDNGWDDLKDIDLRGKIVVILDAQLPGFTFPLGFTMTGRLYSRINVIRERGAAAVLSVVDMERERQSGREKYL